MSPLGPRPMLTWWILGGLALLLGAILVLTRPAAESDDLEGMTNEQLADEMLREEIRELRAATSWAGQILALVPLGTLAVGLGGAAIAYVRFRHDRKVETSRRVDERFAQVAADLGSDNEVVRSGAAVALRTFFKPHYDTEVFDDAFALVLANLKIADHPDLVHRLLTEAFSAGLRRREPPASPESGLDLARAWLKRADLEGCSLRFADLAWAKLHGARLRGCDLRDTQGIGVFVTKAVLSEANLHQARWQQAEGSGAYFHNARMASIDLKGATLNGAKFEGAKLQAAHFKDAQLNDASFDGANINDTHFEGAILNDAALRSIMRAEGNAHFDAHAIAAMERLRR